MVTKTFWKQTKKTLEKVAKRGQHKELHNMSQFRTQTLDYYQQICIYSSCFVHSAAKLAVVVLNFNYNDVTLAMGYNYNLRISISTDIGNRGVSIEKF